MSRCLWELVLSFYHVGPRKLLYWPSHLSSHGFWGIPHEDAVDATLAEPSPPAPQIKLVNAFFHTCFIEIPERTTVSL